MAASLKKFDFKVLLSIYGFRGKCRPHSFKMYLFYIQEVSNHFVWLAERSRLRIP